MRLLLFLIHVAKPVQAAFQRTLSAEGNADSSLTAWCCSQAHLLAVL